MSTHSETMRTEMSSATSFNSAVSLTIRVGEGTEQRDFVAHEAFLTSRSEYFRCAMDGKWEETEPRVVNLSDVDPETFATYMSLVYTGQIPVTTEQAQPMETISLEEASELCRKEHDSLFCLYILANKLEDAATKDATIKAIFKVIKFPRQEHNWTIPKYETLSMVYEQLPTGSPAKRLAVDIASNCSIDRMSKEGDTLPKEYLRDLVVLLRRRAKKEHGGKGSKNEAKRNGADACLEETTEKTREANAPSPEI